MQNRFYILGAMSVLAIAACSPAANEDTAVDMPAPSMTNMPDMSQAAVQTAEQGAIIGVGVVTAVNSEAGTVGLKHEPIPALNWSSMSMTFAADPPLLADITVGDDVSFEIKSAEESQTIVAISKR